VLIPRIEQYGLRIRPGKDFEIVNPNSDPRFRDYWQEYYALVQRKGVSVEYAKREVTRRTTLIGSLMVRRGDADAMLCGTIAEHSLHLGYVANVIGLRKGVNQFAAMNMLILPKHTLFICDTYVNPDPTAVQLAEITMLAADEVQRFGIVPRIALLSHSNFGSSLTNDGGQNAVEPRSGKQAGYSCKNADEDDGKTSGRHRLVHERAHGLHITQGEFGIELGDRGANRWAESFGTPCGSHEPSTRRSCSEESFDEKNRFAAFRRHRFVPLVMHHADHLHFLILRSIRPIRTQVSDQQRSADGGSLRKSSRGQ